MFGAAAMSLSSFCVVSNALRLNLLKVYDSAKDKPLKHRAQLPEFPEPREAQPAPELTMHIEGMMCMHCERRVKNALEALEQVSEAIVSHEAGTAIVRLTAPVDHETLTKAVTDQYYEVLKIE